LQEETGLDLRNGGVSTITDEFPHAIESVEITPTSAGKATVKIYFTRKNGNSSFVTVPNLGLDGSHDPIPNFSDGSNGSSPSVDIIYGKDLIFSHNYAAVSDLDGQPNQIIETNSDGLQRVTASVPAYCKYPAMQTAHMLTPSCQTMVYNGGMANPPSPPIVANSTVVSSSATTWTNQTANGAWLPEGSYAWNVPLSSTTGLAERAMNDFVFPQPTTPPVPFTPPADWICTGKITKYSDYSQVLESVKAPTSSLPLYSTTSYDRNSVYPVASASNARYGECIYTSFEDWDATLLNSLKSPQTTATLDIPDPATDLPAPSGKTVLRITGVAGTQSSSFDQWVFVGNSPANAQLSGTRKITWEFWAKGGGNWHSNTCLQTNESGTPCYGFAEFDVTPQWQKYSFTADVPLNANVQYHVVLRPPCHKSGSNWIYDAGSISYDGVRAYPDAGLMSSSTVDPVLGVVTSTTDENNNTHKTAYDGFGRVTAQYNAKGQLLKSYSYHLMPELYTNPFNSSGQNFIVNTGSPVPSIVSGVGMGSGGSCSKVDFKGTGYGNLVRLDLPAANFKGKKGTVQGYYKSTSGNNVEIALWWDANQTTKHFVADGTWQTFSIDFDFTGLTPSTVKIYADMFTGSDYIAYFDEINAFGW
jgi:YD repeat-containing protein